MRILFLSHYFPPEVNAPASRTYEHCKHWVEAGCEVTVISCVPHHPMGRVYPGYKNKFMQSEVMDGIQLYRVLTYVTPNEGFLKRTFNYLFYMLMAVVVSFRLGRFDVVISTSPQFFNGLAGYFVSRIKKAPWLLEIRDLWPESIVAVGALRSRPLIMLLEYLERFAYAKADRIVSVTQSFVTHIGAVLGSEEKVSVIYNGVDLQAFPSHVEASAFRERIGTSGKFVAAYVGTHGMAHGLSVLVQAAQLLREFGDIVIVTAGEGAEYERLKVAATGLDNFIMLGQLPKSDMPALWSSVDVSIIHLVRNDLFKTVIPSKMFESMAIGKPIVLGVEGESERLLERSGAGMFFQPEDAQALVNCILDLYRDAEMYRSMSQRGRPFVSSHFDRTKLASDYLHLISKARERSNPPDELERS